MTTRSIPGVTHLSCIYEQGWRMVVRAVDLPRTGALPEFACKSLSLARLGPHRASLQPPLIRERGEPQGDGGLLPCLLFSFCIPVPLWEPQLKTPAWAEGKTSPEKPHDPSSTATADPGRLR